MRLNEQKQQLSLPAIISLFTIEKGTSVFRFVSAPRDANFIQFNGLTYTPVPIKAKGFTLTTTGTIPRPTLTISNIENQIVPLLVTHDDLIGAKVTRLRVFEHHLDGGDDPDTTQRISADVYLINRKSKQKAEYVEWELASPLDHEGVKLPRRQILRSHCQSIYRRYENRAFQYQSATCPYVGRRYYDEQGKKTTKTKDQCGKRLSDCKKRFGQHAVLPFDGFPGVARVRRS